MRRVGVPKLKHAGAGAAEVGGPVPRLNGVTAGAAAGAAGAGADVPKLKPEAAGAEPAGGPVPKPKPEGAGAAAGAATIARVA